ncbi:MAG: multicopper oxidase domain-containing protein [Geobacteraceae bacterium]
MKMHNLLTWAILALAIVAFSGGFDPGSARAAPPITAPGSVPDYFETPNWANSPPLRKFVDGLPGLCGPGSTGMNNLDQCIPVAEPDTGRYPGSDYYEIELVQYREQLHSDLLPPGQTRATGLGKINATTGGSLLRGYRQTNTSNPDLTTPHYLGPLIIAQKDRPVRIKFTNSLPTGAGGNLFIPTDTSIMGAGEGPKDINGNSCDPETQNCAMFSQNRADLHLHGGRTPWISDGTPHQWITPAGEITPFPAGVSVQNVPDMPDPGPGSQTYYYTNQQSARLLFYHDHAWGITRLNVYVGEAAGYLIQDPLDLALVNGGTINGRTFAAGTIPADQIPLIIQDKTFVDPLTIMNTDPTWAWGSTAPTPFAGAPTVPGQGMNPVLGDLWWPHVYMPAQNPYNPDMSGASAMGRWHYGPWFFPPTPTCGTAGATKPLCVEVGPVPNPHYDPNCVPDPTLVENNNFCQPPEMPGTPNTSWGAEAFLDTMLVNGTAYPKVTLDPKPYRFRVLNASHDRFVNLQLYLADGTQVNPACPTCAPNTEVKMVPAAPGTPGFPENWPGDGREGGVPDPATRGPAWIQIGSEGGFLPEPVVLPNHPVMWNVDPTMFNVGNVLQQNQGGGTLILGPAERGDVIVDFSKFAGKTLILYNDAPTAFPALDPHYDYYTGAPDRTDIGGATSIPVGVAPNIRTVMQITINPGADSSAPVDDYNPAILTRLQEAFKTTAASPGVFESGQDKVVVGQTAYNTTYNTTFPSTFPYWGLSRITDSAISFKDPNGITVNDYPLGRKAIHDEMGATFDDFGRMSAKLGLEVPFTNAANQNFVLQNYVDPSTENVNSDVQIWRITHNGVDSHPVHFHLFDVQVLNRVGWDGFIRVPDTNELGWKETVRVSPLEDTIVALRPITPTVPFALPNSFRPLNPAFPIGSEMGFSQIDPLTGGPLTTPNTNQMTDFGHEYVWHCHILSHEENDMMRPVIFRPPTSVPVAPALAAPVTGVQSVSLTWTHTSNATNLPAGYRVERRTGTGAYATVATINFSTILSYIDTTVAPSTPYTYRVYAFNGLGDSLVSNTQTVTSAAWTAPTVTLIAPATGVAPGPISISATATAAGATVSKVEYYNGGILIGTRTSTSAPSYSFDWMNMSAGTYTLTAKVYNSLGATAVSAPVAVTVTAAPATGVSITPDKVSPQSITTPGGVTFTAAGQGGSGTYEFEFWQHNGVGWSKVQAYSTNSSWVWNTATAADGIYTVQVNVRNAGSTASFEAWNAIIFQVYSSSPATGVSLVTDKPSPQPTTTPGGVTFTAAGQGGSGTYEYEFWQHNGVSWSKVQAYSTNNNWVWNTATATGGIYTMQVNVRNAGSTASFEAWNAIIFQVDSGSSATGVSLVTDKPSPQPTTTPGGVTFTAAGQGGSGTYEYEFWQHNGVSWSKVQAYSTNSNWVWNTAAALAGGYTIQVNARSAGSAASYEAYNSAYYVLQ